MPTPTPFAVRPRRTALRAVGAAAVLLAFISLPVTAAVAEGAAPTARAKPQLSIAVDNGKKSVRSGDTVHYTVTVKNLGAGEVDALRVTQSLPAGLTFVSADANGTANKTEVVWRVDLKPAATTSLRTTMKVVDTPKTLLRLATVACAGLSATSPVVCATHSDQLPAGAAAQAAARDVASSGSDDHDGWWIAGGSAAVLGGVALGVAATRRRRRRPTSQ
jgi:uncharacterized repeat protein (TIGR01451 family)